MVDRCCAVASSLISFLRSAFLNRQTPRVLEKSFGQRRRFLSFNTNSRKIVSFATPSQSAKLEVYNCFAPISAWIKQYASVQRFERLAVSFFYQKERPQSKFIQSLRERVKTAASICCCCCCWCRLSDWLRHVCVGW